MKNILVAKAFENKFQSKRKNLEFVISCTKKNVEFEYYVVSNDDNEHYAAEVNRESEEVSFKRISNSEFRSHKKGWLDIPSLF